MLLYGTFAANVMSSSQDEAYSSGHFKDVKGLIMGMLETYNYEEVSNLLSPTTLCVELLSLDTAQNNQSYSISRCS